MRNVTTAEIEDVVGRDQLTIVDCYADWCGPCKMLKPMLERISEDYNVAAVEFVALDIDTNPEFAQKNNVRGIPTLLWYKSGKLVHTSVGVPTEKVIRESIVTHT